MPDHVDPLRNLLDSTRRCCSLLSGLVSSFVSGHYPVVVGALLGSSSKRGAQQGDHSGVMADTHYIEVSSTDSDSDDWDLEKYKNLDATPPRDTATSSSTTFLPSRASAPSTSRGGPSAFDGWDIVDYGEVHALPPKEPSTSTNARILPPWASNPGTSLTGRREPQHKVRSASYGSSSNFNTNRQATPQMHIARNGNSTFPTRNGSVAEPIIVSGSENIQQNSRKGGMQTHDTLKRTLPTSLQPSVPSGRPSNLVENVGSNQFRDSHAKSYQSAWPTSSNDMNLMKDQFSTGGDDVVMYDNKGSRVLPSSLLHTKSFATTKYVSSSDPGYRPGVGEEIHSENDERLVYQAAVQDLHQPKTEASLPEGLLSVPLLRHQKIALQWMQQKEGSLKNTTCLGGILADDQGLGKTISMIALIQYQKSLESKPKPEDQCIQKAEALNLDDDDGGGTSVREIRSGKPSAGTLVVCPASVLRQWARELEEKVADEAKLSVLVYHGGNRTKDPVELASHDVVLTTYSIVTNEVPKLPMVNEEDDDQKNGDYGLSSDFSSNKKRKQVPNASKSRKKGRKGVDNSAIDSDCGTLARVRWLRVILDEAQTIKNHRTQVARACCGLKAKKRWCLSGTPIQNAIDELFSYFRFLRYDPYTKYKSFYNTIKVPIAKDSTIGYMKLQAVLRGIMLRRTKGTRIDGQPIITLPPKTIRLTRVDFSVEERAFYSKLEADSRSQFKAYAAAGTLNQNYANILLLLLRLRQACDHPLLVKGFSTDSVGRDSFKMAKKLPRDMLINLAKHLDTSFAICDVCSDPPEDAVVTICGHVFCYQCVSELLTGDENTCPSPGCKEQLGANVVFSKATLRSCISDDLDGNSSISSESTDKSKVLQNEYTSSKIKAILEILESHCTPKSSISERRDLASCNGALSDSESPTDRPIKAIIFSQWTGMLDLIEMSLNHSYLHHRRLDGTMTLSARDRAVKEFNTDPEVTVMLMSLKAGNLGLNMVAASHVILVDLWWNPTTEDQAIDRAHRIGQTRPVTVSRLTIKDTVEDRILSLQEEKRKIVASAFGEDPSGASAARLSVEDLRKLFGI